MATPSVSGLVAKKFVAGRKFGSHGEAGNQLKLNTLQQSLKFGGKTWWRLRRNGDAFTPQ